METLVYITHLIGSTTPLIILYYIMVFVIKGKKIKMQTMISYLVVAFLMFFILLRT